ncbi:hypothetical protein ACFVZ3_25750 [Kitasatospora purpeofusca]
MPRRCALPTCPAAAPAAVPAALALPAVLVLPVVLAASRAVGR